VTTASTLASLANEADSAAKRAVDGETSSYVLRLGKGHYEVVTVFRVIRLCSYLVVYRVR
jgi:hypothetical protein